MLNLFDIYHNDKNPIKTLNYQQLTSDLNKVKHNPSLACDYARKIGKPVKELEEIIATDARSSFFYAKDVLKGKFTLAEPTICKSPEYASRYTVEVLKKAFPEAEPAIAKDAFGSITYAKMLGKRFKLGEKTILSSTIQYMVMYAIVIKERFLEAEKYIVKSSSYKRKYYNEMMKLGIRISKYNI